MLQSVELPCPVVARRAKSEAEADTQFANFDLSALEKQLLIFLKVSKVESTALILGESGTGKGLVADRIHKHSARSDQPMIKINSGAIPESLVESELFGYEKGAFTGANRSGKPGYFELADGGILFLDEIAELPLSSQVKLLRFLEDGQVARVGATAGRRVDVRILAATSRNLETMAEAGDFRRDLYYRLNVIPLRMPPLRERRECLLPLIRHFLPQRTHIPSESKRFCPDRPPATLKINTIKPKTCFLREHSWHIGRYHSIKPI